MSIQDKTTSKSVPQSDQYAAVRKDLDGRGDRSSSGKKENHKNDERKKTDPSLPDDPRRTQKEIDIDGPDSRSREKVNVAGAASAKSSQGGQAPSGSHTGNGSKSSGDKSSSSHTGSGSKGSDHKSSSSGTGSHSKSSTNK